MSPATVTQIHGKVAALEAYFESWWWQYVINPSEVLFYIGLVCSFCVGIITKCAASNVWGNYLWSKYGPNGPDGSGVYPKEQWWQWVIGAITALLCLLFFWPIAAVIAMLFIAVGFASS